MKKMLFFLVCFAAGKICGAQKIDSIYFHLYVDSLKKGFYNYINVDGQTKEGKWMPLSANEIFFTATEDSALRFQGNDLFIDSAYNAETVRVRAVLKSNPKVWKEVIIYIRKRGFDELLPTNEQMMDGPKRTRKKS